MAAKTVKKAVIDGDSIHLNTIKTVCNVVKLFEDSFNLFMEEPSGDNYKDMESKRNNMFKTSSICNLTTFPDDSNSKDKEALEIGRQAMKYREAQEKLISL
jgi:hypothetical protein